MNKPRYNYCEICKHEFEAMKTADKLIKAKEAIDEAIQNYERVKSNPVSTPEPHTTVAVWGSKDWWIDLEAEDYERYDHIPNHYEKDLFLKVGYTFSGTPDIDRVIADTLKRGALAVKVECTKNISLKGEQTGNGGYIFKECLKPYISSWHFKNYLCYYFFDSDNHIEQAITEYLSKQEQQEPEIKEGDVVWCEDDLYQVTGFDYGDNYTDCMVADTNGDIEILPFSSFRKATPDEVIEWFTVEVDGIPTWIWEDKNGRMVIQQENRSHDLGISSTNTVSTALFNAFKEKYGFSVIPYSWAQKLWGDERPYPKGE